MTLGWYNIVTRYRRTKLGPLWISIAMLVNVVCLGVLWGHLFGVGLRDFIAHVAFGLVFWTLFSTIIQDGCNAFIEATSYIHSIRQPLSTYIFSVIWRQLLILAHNFAVIFVGYLLVGPPLGWPVLSFFLGLPLALLVLTPVMLIAAIVSTRYRDVPPVVQSIVGLAFYMSPIIWKQSQLGDYAWLAEFNPFTHLLNLVRMPFLEELPPLRSWAVAIGLATTGWLIALTFYSRYRARIAYWL